MDGSGFGQLKDAAAEFSEPENYFSGLRLPPDFVLPDNIVVFHHNFAAPLPSAHGRSTLIAPLGRMIYFVEDRRLDVAEGDMIFIPPHHMRFLHPKSESFDRLLITFDFAPAQENPPSGFVSRRTERADTLLLRFLRFYRENNAPESVFTLFALLRELRGTRSAVSDVPRFPRPVLAALGFISTHLSDRIGNPEIAEAAGISESHLRYLFRKHTGLTPGEYLAHERLAAAKHRLLHTSMSIEETAKSCGYANVYVFSAFFRAHEGVSPLHYRRNFH